MNRDSKVFASRRFFWHSNMAEFSPQLAAVSSVFLSGVLFLLTSVGISGWMLLAVSGLP